MSRFEKLKLCSFPGISPFSPTQPFAQPSRCRTVSNGSHSDGGHIYRRRQWIHIGGIVNHIKYGGKHEHLSLQHSATKLLSRPQQDSPPGKPLDCTCPPFQASGILLWMFVFPRLPSVDPTSWRKPKGQWQRPNRARAWVHHWRLTERALDFYWFDGPGRGFPSNFEASALKTLTWSGGAGIIHGRNVKTKSCQTFSK